jgi:hypothetical protein
MFSHHGDVRLAINLYGWEPAGPRHAPIFYAVLPSASKPVDRSQSRGRRHTLGGDHHDLTTHLQDQLCQIIEQVVNFRVLQVAERNPTSRGIYPAGNLALGFDQQCRHPPGRGGFRDLRQCIGPKALRASLAEGLDQPGKACQILGLDRSPGTVTERIDRQGIRMDIEALIHQEWVLADLAEEGVMFWQCRQ